MNVLHVNNVDLYGRRFNGYDLLEQLQSRGVDGRQAVLLKLSRNPRVFPLLRDHADEYLQGTLRQIEKRRSMNNLLFPWGRRLTSTSEFAWADIVHYHLIHNEMVSLFDLPWMFALKPAVWTFHDPWPLTGHCIHPMSCDGWLEGCETCPSLDTIFSMEADNANRMWRVKQRVYKHLDADIVVASPFMFDLARRSPLTSHFQRIHLIPFGIDTSAYLPDEMKLASRAHLGIPRDDFVVLFRATTSEFKGLPYVLEALGMRPPERDTTLITVDQRGVVKPLATDYNVVEMGWVEDQSLYPQIFSACDVFLMPSTAEAFGLMALEAMAAGRPVVCFEGTSLPSVTHAPECGIAVPMGDSTALRAALDSLAHNPAEAHRRGELGQAIAREQYSHEGYLDELAALYRSVHERKQ